MKKILGLMFLSVAQLHCYYGTSLAQFILSEMKGTLVGPVILLSIVQQSLRIQPSQIICSFAFKQNNHSNLSLWIITI